MVYEAYDQNYERRTYQAPYTLGEDGLTLGTPEVITIAEVIQPRKSPSKPPAAKAPGATVAGARLHRRATA